MVERRVQQLIHEGVEGQVRGQVGVDVTVEELKERFDAVVLTPPVPAFPVTFRRRAAKTTVSISRWTISTAAIAGWRPESVPSR